jgi:putative toxin-antitoxin system antitoxin component (TIGR02293 family)
VLSEQRELKRVETWLGGPKVIRRKLKTKLDVHEVSLRGLPNVSVAKFIGRLVLLRGNVPALEKIMGMSLRTLQRKRQAPTKALSQEQTGRTLKFAEVLAKATEVFGSQQNAEEWLQRPAMGLNDRLPIELLATPTGAKLVEDFLTRLEYGAYT